MARRIRHTVLVASVIAASLLARPAAAAEQWIVAVGEEAKIYDRFDVTADVKLIDSPLSQVLHFLSDSYGVPIILDEVALSEAGIPSDVPIHLDLTRTTLPVALRRLLEPLALDYHVEDGVVKVTTFDVRARRVVARVYDVGPLVSGDAGGAQLAEALRAAVFPPDEKESSEGSLTGFRTTLVVRGPLRSHDRLISLLDHLKAGLERDAKRARDMKDSTP